MSELLILAWLCKKYVQRADDRQKAMGLQYTEAETHDLAREFYKAHVAPLEAEVEKLKQLCRDLSASPDAVIVPLHLWRRIKQAAACCAPTAEEEALLANGEYTPEELWGGREPTCPKCIGKKS